MLGNSLGYTAATCLILLVGGCAYKDGVFSADPVAAAASQTMPREEDFVVESSDDLSIASGKAVLALLKQSTAAANAGKVDDAAAILERALHIEPRNAYLYSRLASLRIEQERFEEAESLAAKSNSIASRNARLQERNWRVIAISRDKRGDSSGASLATQRADQLREFIQK